MNVFFATPISKISDENMMLFPEYVPFFEKLISRAKQEKIKYFLAVEREDFGKKYVSDEESTKTDYLNILDCDLMCMIFGNPISTGVHVELGIAAAKGKPVNIFLNKHITYSPMVTGISSVTEANIYYYDNEFSDELLDQIFDSISKMKLLISN